MSYKARSSTSRKKLYLHYYENNKDFKAYADKCRIDSLSLRVIASTRHLLNQNGWDKYSKLENCQNGGPTSLQHAMYLAAIRSVPSASNSQIKLILDNCRILFLQSAYELTGRHATRVDRNGTIAEFENRRNSPDLIINSLTATYDKILSDTSNIPDDIATIYRKINYNNRHSEDTSAWDL